MADYVVGDIQACYSELRLLLDKAGFNPANDKLWATGDLIGRGPQALQTLTYLRDLGDSFETVLGNHDLHFLAVSQKIKSDKPENKFESVLTSPALNEIVEWLRHKPLACKIMKGRLLTHAGLYPGWSLKDAIEYSDEVSKKLSSPDWHQLLQSMYSNNPLKWSNKLKGIPRYRFIINAMTRMRFVTQNGELNFSAKSSIASAPKHLQPWFSHPATQLKPHQQVLFGHWAALDGETGSEQFIGLDTGCVWGNKLTLLNLETNDYFFVKA
ncbi:symmetrical bis(5'-nucleosyl)-tetraphosphatase [Neptunicella marina]|uniref:bis(5'-nucleosyl)-tetraphosphatase (symmetrical) n=1 Tax=Neptunicella marina TaxID=2125989 RepID=A0A8J6IRB8_9ALTE|nr:symmetrical bis(5'-nucleosyl)-tetraphosphatase [Neptunicella marina]MBC3765391.1 symmetrical bis(5'-nucleosyl)-tetraphosphatase [Neptunicella marina]